MQCLCTVFLTSVSLSWSIIHIQCYVHFRCTTWYFDLYMHYKPSRSIGFSRQEYWSRLSLPSPGDLPDPRIKPTSFETPSLAGRFFNTTPPGRPPNIKWFSSVQSLSCVLLFASPRTAACQASLSIPKSSSLPKLMSIELVLPSNCLILCCTLLLPSIFPRIRMFSNKSALPYWWPKYWSLAWTLVLPMNTQDWSPLGWTGWISLQYKGLSRVFSNTTVQKHQFFGTQLSL